jgi:uncharacterized protein (TIGR03032 family)
MGLSLPRGEHALTGLPLDENLRARKTEARCALQIVNLKSGNIAHWLRIDGVVRELYDVAVLPGVMRPMAIGFKSDEIQRIVSVGSEPAPAARADTLPQSAGPSADKPPQ